MDTEQTHYARFIELWLDCDAELRRWVEQAEERVEALSDANASPQAG